VQGRALGRLPEIVDEILPGLGSDAQRCLQFVRSTPQVTTAVVGMREPDHVDENLALAQTPPVPAEAIETLFKRAARSRP
jgi:aryl-alcohol dehydrogenase-like predicted oxidoreductase